MTNRDKRQPAQSETVKSCPVTSLDRAMAKICLNCLLCRNARKRQAGAMFWLVKHVERRVCPFCRAYERVYERKAHER